MWAGLCVKGLAKGLVITGVTGFALTGICIYLYLLLVTSTTWLGFFNYIAVNIPIGVLVAYLSTYFTHVGVDSFILLTSIRKRGVKGLEICV